MGYWRYYSRSGFAAGRDMSAREQRPLVCNRDTNKCFSQITISSLITLKECSHGFDEQMALQESRLRDQSSAPLISMSGSQIGYGSFMLL